jgi:hypothetical protein
MNKAHRPLHKQLMSVAVTYESLDADEQVVLKYKVDDGSYVTVFTEATDGVIVTEMPKATDEFTAGREYQFRIESTGGAEITGLYYTYELIPSHIYG